MTRKRFQYQVQIQPVSQAAEAVTEDKWHFPWSEPIVKAKAGVAASRNQFFASNIQPNVSFGWMEELSKPPIIEKRGLGAARQQFFAADTTPIPVSMLIGWFGNLSDPIRIKLGLTVALQQFLAHPPQLRPTPTTFAVMNALETPDVFLGGVTLWNAIRSGEAGVVIITAPGSEAGLAPGNTASPIASAAVSIVIL